MSNLYDEMINDCYPVIKIGNLTFEPARVLKECDTIAYRCGEADYFDSVITDFLYEHGLDANTLYTDGTTPKPSRIGR